MRRFELSWYDPGNDKVWCIAVPEDVVSDMMKVVFSENYGAKAMHINIVGEYSHIETKPEVAK